MYIFPKMSCEQQDVSRYAEPYQPMSSREWNPAVILGVATPRMERSCDTEWLVSISSTMVSIIARNV